MTGHRRESSIIKRKGERKLYKQMSPSKIKKLN